jgi:PAS domain S-box-containing protein
MQDREKLALVAVERTRMPMLVTDPAQPDNPIILANQAFLDLSGYTPEEVVGRKLPVLAGPRYGPPAGSEDARGDLCAKGDHH